MLKTKFGFEPQLSAETALDYILKDRKQNKISNLRQQLLDEGYDEDEMPEIVDGDD